MEIVVAITGASGAVLGVEFVRKAVDLGIKVNLVISEWGERTLRAEGFPDPLEMEGVKRFDNANLLAPFSSGSYYFDAMVVIPCSMNTLSMIANGISNDLITRAASVALKERRKLILVVRETPLSTIHIENMLKVSQAGGIILPPVLAFYHKPETVEDLINYVVGKVFDQLGVNTGIFKRWGKGE